MTVKELGSRMDAAELSEWIAYYTLQDEEECEKIKKKVLMEKDESYHIDKLRNFLTSFTNKVSKNGKNK